MTVAAYYEEVLEDLGLGVIDENNQRTKVQMVPLEEAGERAILARADRRQTQPATSHEEVGTFGLHLLEDVLPQVAL
jgi:hypothetical protein